MKLIIQKRINECYVACACEVLRFFNINFSYEKAKRSIKANDFFHIRLFLETKNLSCNSYRFDNKESVYKYRFKIGIAQYKTLVGYHFVCFYKNNGTFYIKRPNNLRSHRLTKNKLRKWTGNIMFIDKIVI